MPWGGEGRAIDGAFLLDRVDEATGRIRHGFLRDPFGKREKLWILPVLQVAEFLQKMPPSITGSKMRSKTIRVIPPVPWTPQNVADYIEDTPVGGLITLPTYVVP